MICYKLHQPFSLVGFEDLDVVTQSLIKEVIKQGISMDGLSDLNNFTSLNKNKHLLNKLITIYLSLMVQCWGWKQEIENKRMVTHHVISTLSKERIIIF